MQKTVRHVQQTGRRAEAQISTAHWGTGPLGLYNSVSWGDPYLAADLLDLQKSGQNEVNREI